MKRLLLITLLLTCLTINAQDTLYLNSDYIPHTDTTLVFVPKTTSSHLFPAVIMLHGWAGNYNQWNEIMGGLQRYADSLEMVIVCPDGFFDSFYINSPIKENSQFESFFWEVFIPTIFEKYPIDKSKLFITGLSMGGHGALSLFLKRPDLFLAGASTSGVLDLMALPNRPTITNAAGKTEDYSQAWEENSSAYLLKNIAGKDKKIFFDCGTEDFLYNINIKFKEKCDSLNVKYECKFQPGVHDKKYWNKSVRDHFSFFLSMLKK